MLINQKKKAKPEKQKLTRKQKKEINKLVASYKGDGKAHSAQDSIPYELMFEDGLCRLDKTHYSKCIEFEDVNYQLAGDDEQKAIFEYLCDFYNYFDSSVSVQLSLISRFTNREEWERVIAIESQDDKFNEIRDEYRNMLKDQRSRGNNGLVKTKYVTLTIEAENEKAAKAGQEEAVKAEYNKGYKGRWGAGLPGGGDSQMLFLQSAVAKMDNKVGRAAIIENGAPLFTGGTSSGESQIRRWLLENDLIEAIIAMPTDLFYNTGLATYVWILSKNKRAERVGKIQLIDATNIFHKLRKPLGDKKNEFTKEDRAKITKLYADYTENELVQIFDNTEFIYREYSVMQPLQRSYSITNSSIQSMIDRNSLSSLYDEGKVFEYENTVDLSDKEKMKLDEFRNNKALYDEIIKALQTNISSDVYNNPMDFSLIIERILTEVISDKKVLRKIVEKVVDGLSKMDKNAEIQVDKKGNIIFDKETKGTEIVKWDETIEAYMEREVLPYIPDAVAFFEEDLSKKNPVIKTGAEIPFTRYFYKYQKPQSSEDLERQFLELEKTVDEKIRGLFGKE